MRFKFPAVVLSLALFGSACSSGSVSATTASDTTEVEMDAGGIEARLFIAELNAVNVAYPNGFTNPGRIRAFAESIGVSGPGYRFGEGAVYYLMADADASRGPSDILGARSPATSGSFEFFDSLVVGQAYSIDAFSCASPAVANFVETWPYGTYSYTANDWNGVWGSSFYLSSSTPSALRYKNCNTFQAATVTPIGWQVQEVSLAGPTTNPMAGESAQLTSSALGDSIERGQSTYSVSETDCNVTASGAVTKTSAGDCVVTLTVAQGRTYLEGSAEITITFDAPPRSPISVSAADASAVAGSEIAPTLAVVSGSLLSGDELGSATFTFEGTGDTTYGPSTTPPTDAGTYLVTPSELQFSPGDPESYETTFVAGTLTVTPREISVASSDVSSEVGTSFEARVVVSQGELLSGDELGSATFTYEGTGDTTYGPSTTAPTAVGTYSVTPSALTLSAGDTANYDITYAAGTLTITAAPAASTPTTPPTTTPPTTTPPTTTDAPSADETPMAPVRDSSGNLFDLIPGEESIIEGDNWENLPDDVPSEVVRDGDSLLLRPSSGDGDYNVRLSAQCGSSPCPIDTRMGADGNEQQVMRLDRSDDGARLSGSGFKPGTEVRGFIFSEPRYLGSATVTADGSFSMAIPLAGMEPGEHTLQLNGIMANGRVRSGNIGVVVEAGIVELPQTGASSSLIAWSLLFATLGGFFILTSRRRAGC